MNCHSDHAGKVSRGICRGVALSTLCREANVRGRVFGAVCRLVTMGRARPRCLRRTGTVLVVPSCFRFLLANIGGGRCAGTAAKRLIGPAAGS